MFYVMAEMWGSVVASLLFWSFANEVTTVDEAKKYCKFVEDEFLFAMPSLKTIILLMIYA